MLWGVDPRVSRCAQSAIALQLPLSDVALKRLGTLFSLFDTYAHGLDLFGGGEGSLEAQVEASMVAAAAVSAFGGGRWIDVGSGGGFPGLVFAAVVDDGGVLVEPRLRRFSFLELGVGALRRPEVRARRGRVGHGWEPADGGGDLRGAFRLASARAVWEPGEWLEIGRGLVEPGGGVLVHTSVGAEDVGEPPVVRVDFDRWSARIYRA